MLLHRNHSVSCASCVGFGRRNPEERDGCALGENRFPPLDTDWNIDHHAGSLLAGSWERGWA